MPRRQQKPERAIAPRNPKRSVAPHTSDCPNDPHTPYRAANGAQALAQGVQNPANGAQALASAYPEAPACPQLGRALLAWFTVHKRPLPWRRDYEPYAVWISEIMLQQTQMERAVGYFERWMRRFPNLKALAGADPDEVLKAWEGLGYYSRVRNLHAAAQVLVREHGGVFPQDFAAWRQLPGVGDYTAGAVLSVAFNQPQAAVDANVERVFARLFDLDAPVKSREASAFLRRAALALMPEGRARDFNQALMELGALICAKKPLCGQCPVSAFCRARHLGIVHERPLPGRKTAYSHVEIATGVLLHAGRVFVQKRPETGVWAGFWELPGGRVEPGESPEQAVVREYLEETEFRVRVVEHLGLVRHGYTRYRIAMHCFALVLDEQGGGSREISPKPGPGQGLEPTALPQPVLHAADEYRWLEPDELTTLVLPAGHRKLLDGSLARIRELSANFSEGALPPQTPPAGE